jgi:membrane-associated PAP2 superfamily phosphatase
MLKKAVSLSQLYSLNIGKNFYSQRVMYLKQAMGLLITAYFLAIVYPETGLDQLLIAKYFDAVSHHFPLKHEVLLEQFMHTGLKYCIMVVAIASLLAALQPQGLSPQNMPAKAGYSYVKPNIHAPYRTSFLSRIQILFKNPYFYAFIGMVISTSVVAYLKSTSMHACPSDLTIYGGDLPLYKLFETLPAGMKAGHCFPSGHASGGFALMVFYFAFRQTKPMFAAISLSVALVLGFAMGWAQMLRGEHFLSHNLWSAWVVWAVLYLQTLVWPIAANHPESLKYA